jgi:hypothetical protein
MSTKIYNAYKYNDTLCSLINNLKKIRILYQNDKIDYISKLEDLEVVTENDEKVLLKDLPDNILGEMHLKNFLENIIKRGYNEPLNIQASAVVYALKSDLYVQFFGIKSDYIKHISNLEDFHYQNNTDMSNYDWDTEKWEDMSEERQQELENDWTNRKNIWDEIFNNNNDTPGESGLCFDFHPSDYNMILFCNRILEKIKLKNDKKS